MKHIELIVEFSVNERLYVAEAYVPQHISRETPAFISVRDKEIGTIIRYKEITASEALKPKSGAPFFVDVTAYGTLVTGEMIAIAKRYNLSLLDVQHLDIIEHILKDRNGIL